LSTKDAAELLSRPANRCLVCGPDNPYGFHIDFRTEADGSVSAEWVALNYLEGWAGVLHGGIVCTLLDEAMAKAVVAAGERAMTVEIQVRYRHYVATGEKLRIRGRVVERKRRRLRTEAEITTIDGEPRAQATATFLTLS